MSDASSNPTAEARRMFLADQLAAAAVDTHAQVTRAASRRPQDPAAALRHPVVRRFTERLALWTRAGLIHLCAHLDPSAPARMYWLVGLPELIRCSLCTAAADGDLLQRREQPCDHCGRTTRTALLEPVLIAAGPVLIRAAICRLCMELGSGRPQ